jgi:hypothetical protein
MIANTPLAEWYAIKVCGRVGRMLQGEYLGDMIESDLEDMEIDDDFEMQRHQVENVSSSHDFGEGRE